MLPESPVNPMGMGKIPLAYGKPGEIKIWGLLYLYDFRRLRYHSIIYLKTFSV